MNGGVATYQRKLSMKGSNQQFIESDNRINSNRGIGNGWPLMTSNRAVRKQLTRTLWNQWNHSEIPEIPSSKVKRTEIRKPKETNRLEKSLVGEGVSAESFSLSVEADSDREGLREEAPPLSYPNSAQHTYHRPPPPFSPKGSDERSREDRRILKLVED